MVGGPVARLDPASLREQIEERISRRIVGLLSAAGRGKKAAIGAANAEAALRKGSRLVVVAEDVSARVRRDLEAVASDASATVMVFGDRSLLGLAYARALVGAVALTDDGLARAVRHELEMLRGFRVTEETIQNPSQRERMALERAT